MKHLVIFLVPISLISCFDDLNVDSSAANSFSATKNSVEWSGSVQAQQYMLTDSLVISAISKKNSDDGVMWVKIKFTGVGSYALADAQSGFYTTVGEDVIVAAYRLDQIFIPQFQISKYDESQQIIEGNFQIKFKKYRGTDPNAVEIIELEEGKFRGEK